MSIATEITRLQNAKATLKTKLNAKNDSSHQIDNETLDEFGDFVDSIPTGGGGGGIEKGAEFSEYNSDGYPEKVEIKGMTSLPNYFFYVGYDGSVASKIKTVVLPDTCTQLNTSCFYNCKQLQTINIPNTLGKLGQDCFKNCTNLVLTELPSSVGQMGSGIFYGCSSIKEMKFNYQTNVPSSCFYNCSSLKKFCGVNTTGINGSNTGNSGFYNCQNLKQIWLGNKLNGNLMYRWSFASCPNIEKLYINLPRATVSSWTNYQYAFMNDTSKTSVIICNDDAGFITQEQFEALDPDAM